jgi:formiminotetrahydrofolate cyclodeaminase
MGLTDRGVREFLEAVAAPTPTPGGGSVAALCGALSAALSRMVAGLAAGKQGYEDAQEDLRALQMRARDLQNRLLALVERDAAAYDGVVAAMKRPKGTDAEKAARVLAMQEAYVKASEVPLETMEACLEALELALLAAQKGNRSAVTDAGAAALLAEAGLRAASLNVRINLTALKDGATRARIESRLADLLERADKVGRDALAFVEGRM